MVNNGPGSVATELLIERNAGVDRRPRNNKPVLSGDLRRDVALA